MLNVGQKVGELRRMTVVEPVRAEADLDTIRRSLSVSIGVFQFTPDCDLPEWRIDARNVEGEMWIAAHPECGRAVLLLAEAMGVRPTST